MRKAIIAAALAASITGHAHAAQEGDAQQALVAYVIAEQYCGLEAPKVLLNHTMVQALAEMQLPGAQVAEWAYKSAELFAITMVKQGRLVQFCKDIGQVYRDVRP